MASYHNHSEVWFTVQALRLYQDLIDTEILVIDNQGDQNLRNTLNGCKSSKVRYCLYQDKVGTAAAKNKIFDEAAGDWVLSIDSHVLLHPTVAVRLKAWTQANPDCLDLLQGPLLYDDLLTGSDRLKPTWGSEMLGQWDGAVPHQNDQPYEIPMMGMGLFCSRRDSWLRYNDKFSGFGSEEHYIHEKYRQAGRKTLMLPFLRWSHYFRPLGKIPYSCTVEDKLRNYIIGFKELNLDLSPLIDNFGLEMYSKVHDALAKET